MRPEPSAPDRTAHLAEIERRQRRHVAYPAVGSTRYRDLALVALDKLALRAHIGLDERGASASPRVTSTFKLAKGDAAELVVTRVVSEPGTESSQREHTEVVRHRFDAAKAQWVASPARRRGPLRVLRR